MNKQDIHSALKGVIDPELGINIVDLGLVYGVTAAAGAIDVRMTMTTPACPLGEYLTESVERVLRQRFPDAAVRVDLVWDPPWHPGLMTPESRAILGLDHRHQVSSPANT